MSESIFGIVYRLDIRRFGNWEGTQQMRVHSFICAAIAAAIMPVAARADDPNDPAMRSAAARARDREMTRQLNLEEIARVRQRDARSAEGRRTARAGGSYAAGEDEYAARSRDHERAMANYARNRAQYEREMAAWRRAVAACRAGDYSACDD